MIVDTRCSSMDSPNETRKHKYFQFTLSSCEAVVLIFRSNSSRLIQQYQELLRDSTTEKISNRSIAITSLLFKILESLINRQLLGYHEKQQLISNRQDSHQYGLHPYRSAGNLQIKKKSKRKSLIGYCTKRFFQDHIK